MVNDQINKGKLGKGLYWNMDQDTKKGMMKREQQKYHINNANILWGRHSWPVRFTTAN